ncbi:MAG: L-histidine N(alpha)-methyltransferase [Microthrixaceae bacterium]
MPDAPPPVGDGSGTVTVDVRIDRTDWSRHLADETARGLRTAPPWIPPVWFYDELGSKLFDEITRLPEYYPTEAERSILSERSGEIAELTGATTLAELGSGTSDKTMLLIDALHRAGTLGRIAPFDVSEEVLRDAAHTLASRFPGTSVHAVVGDFHRHLGAIPMDGVTLLVFLGSTIGNFEPGDRAAFLDSVGRVLDDDDWFLLGTDLVKDTDRLVAAYDDAAGVTAAFNLNALSVMNAELGGDFDPGAYRHRAVWDAAGSRIEMHLVADRAQVVRLSALEVELRLDGGAHLRTEISTKFRPEQVADELAAAGLRVERTWTDPAGDFLLTLARRG